MGSSRVFQQIVGFSGEIIAYQELHALRDVTLLASSVQPQRRGKRENKRKNKPLNVCRARIVAVIAPQMLSNLIEMAMRSSL